MQDKPFDTEFEKFSVLKRCPMCGKLSLTSSKNKIKCQSCGFEQDIARI